MGLEFLRRKPAEKVTRPPREYQIEYAASILQSGEEVPICTVELRREVWEATLNVKCRLHDQVEAFLREDGRLDDEHHTVLDSPQALGEKTVFQISFREGPRPINLAWIYPMMDKKSPSH